MQGQGKDKDLNSKSASDLSEDLFKVHDFDVKIDLQVPSSGVCVLGLGRGTEDQIDLWVSQLEVLTMGKKRRCLLFMIHRAKVRYATGPSWESRFQTTRLPERGKPRSEGLYP